MERAFTDKAGMTLAVSASLLAPTVADAAIVHVSDRPVTAAIISMTPHADSFAWDVDGDGTAEFTLKQANWRYPVGSRTFYSGRISLTSSGPVNGRGMVGRYSWNPSSGQLILPLPRSSLVGPTLANGYWGGPGVTSRPILSFGYDSLHPPAPSFTPSSHFGFDTGGDNLIGFAFDPGDGVRYGWARLTLAADFFNSAVTIHEWAFEDEPGDSIHVGSVPAPPAALSALTLLGLGAAGVRRWRRQRQDEAAAV